MEFAAWVTGLDRPGIIAAVTGVLLENGCNLEDCSMTILSGHFAMTLLARGDDVTAEDLDRSLNDAVGRLGLTAAVREVDDSGGVTTLGTPHMVAVYGADRPGIVHRVARLLADMGVNITDLTTRVIGHPDEPVYAMHLEVTVPPVIDGGELASELARVGSELGVETSIHPVDVDVL